jgi:DNA-binding NarL/FixJ family response regulator
MIRVLLIENEALAREGLRMLIDRESDLTVVEAVAQLATQSPHLSNLQPDAILMDIDAAELDFMQLARRIRDIWPQAVIVGLSRHWSDELIARSLEAEIRGYVLKDDTFETIRNAIIETCAGNYYYTRRVHNRLVIEDGADGATKASKTRLHLLTQRERQLLRLLASGMSLKRACAAMNVSYKTADKHKVNLMRKLDIHDRVELARYAIREKIVEP